VQQKIVRDYQIIEDRIALKKKINDNLREIASTTFIGKIRYNKSLTEDVYNGDLGVFPSSWRIVSLGDVITTIIDHRGLTPTKLGGEWSNDGIIALSAKSVKNHELINLDIANRVDTDLYEKWMPEKLQPHDILMTSEAPLGEFYYIADYCKYCLSQRLFALRANTDIIEPTVLYFQLTDSIGQHEIDIRKTGTTVTGLRQSELVKIPIVIPSKDIQKQFAELCTPIMLEIERNFDECRKLNKLKDIILSKISSS
jgi:type I restriction enzyme S subunit